jgi:hypothetical protein
MEILAVVSILCVAAFVLVRADVASVAIAVSCAALLLAGGGLLDTGSDEALRAALPGEVREGGYATSDACRACHPGAYQAWHASFHRSMTQAASPATILADWQGVLEDRGRRVRLERRGDEYWASIPDPLWYADSSAGKSASAPQIDVRVVMTTGSHHLQNYWVRRPRSGAVHRGSYDNGALVQIPFVWVIQDQRWVPVQDSFLTPPSSLPEPPQLWNTSCHLCHAVAPQPGFDGQNFNTQVAEIGVACEACHGPAQAHASGHRSPLRRYARHLFGGDAADESIVNPKRLDPERSSQVCAQCHSFNLVLDRERWKTQGVAYTAGDNLEDYKAVLRYSEEPSDPALLQQLAEEPHALVGRFWGDGTIRVAGREFNGMLESACYQQGELTCLSCHSMHDYQDTADQLTAAGSGDGSCRGCHAKQGERIEAHSHHRPESEGSRCMNCHMPHTSYGLFGAIRSHRIDNPNSTTTANTGRPNACSLCHLDRPAQWAQDHLVAWYGQTAVPLPEEERRVASGGVLALRGDAAQRAITAWHMGWRPAQEASGRGWQAAYLAEMLTDPYAAVRRVAAASLRTLPGFADFQYDYIASPSERDARSAAAQATWQANSETHLTQPEALLLHPDGTLDRSATARLRARRDTTPLRIIE